MGHGRPHHRTLTVADNGETVPLRVSQSIDVALVSRGVMWDIPKVSGNAIRRTSASGGYPTHRPAKATFRAVRAGRSSLNSETDAQCLHIKPKCKVKQQEWSVAIVVRK